MSPVESIIGLEIAILQVGDRLRLAWCFFPKVKKSYRHLALDKKMLKIFFLTNLNVSYLNLTSDFGLMSIFTHLYQN